MRYVLVCTKFLHYCCSNFIFYERKVHLKFTATDESGRYRSVQEGKKKWVAPAKSACEGMQEMVDV